MNDRTRSLIEKDKKHLWHPFTQMRSWIDGEPLVIESGDGAELVDTEGNRYLDGVSSLWTNVHGHRRPEIDEAIRAQLDRVAHSTMLGLTHPLAIELAEKLVAIVPSSLTRVFYSDDGSTAAEVALKMAYQYWQHKGQKSRTKFLVFQGAYHGDTIGSVSLGAIDQFHRIFRPLLFHTLVTPAPYCYRCPMGHLSFPSCRIKCLDRAEDLLKSHRMEIAAVVIEPLVQGASGMITQPPAFMQRLQELCRDFDTLLVVDEVATGFGRTGRMFACEHEGIKPDLMAVAKGLSGGYLPIAATLASDRVFEAFLGDEDEKFFHGHTYTGNPLACAAALASLGIFERDKVIENLKPTIDRLALRLKELKDRFGQVGEVRRRGLMTGIELVENPHTRKPFDPGLLVGKRVCAAARNHGVIIRPLGDVVVLMPPLCITWEQIDRLVDRVACGLDEVLPESGRE